MTAQELNAELRTIRLECLIEALTKWASEETEPACEDSWCDGFATGNNHAKEFVKDLLENI